MSYSIHTYLLWLNVLLRDVEPQLFQEYIKAISNIDFGQSTSDSYLFLVTGRFAAECGAASPLRVHKGISNAEC